MIYIDLFLTANTLMIPTAHVRWGRISSDALKRPTCSSDESFVERERQSFPAAAYFWYVLLGKWKTKNNGHNNARTNKKFQSEKL